jgi:hypothetical protein
VNIEVDVTAECFRKDSPPPRRWWRGNLVPGRWNRRGFDRRNIGEAPIMTMLPPPYYDHPPTIPVIEHVLTSDRVDAICQARHTPGADGRAPPPGYRFSGCAHVTARSCEAWRIDDGTERRHELGHRNGWPARKKWRRAAWAAVQELGYLSGDHWLRCTG